MIAAPGTLRPGRAASVDTDDRPLLPLERRGGHANPVAALRYQHATEDRDRAIADALASLATGEIARLSDRSRQRSGS